MRARLAWRSLAVSALIGAAAAFGNAPWNAWYLSLAALVFLFWRLSRTEGAAHGAIHVWAFGAGYFACALSWIVEPFLVDVPRHGWMAPFAITFLSVGLASLWAAAIFAARKAVPGHMIAMSILALTGAEMLRGVLFTGFPWAMIGHIWIDTPVRTLATLGGAPGLTFLTLLIAGLPFVWQRRWIGGAVSLALAVTAFGYGALVLSGAGVTASDKRVRIVQPNALQHQKWDPAMMPVFFSRLVEATAAPGDVDLVLWPESALGARLDRAGDALQVMTRAAQGTPVVFGVNDFVTGRYFNAAAVLDTDGRVSTPYHKHHLVPFGEYIPLAFLLDALGIGKLTETGGSGFASGPGPEVLDLPGIGPGLPLICYELVFARNLRLETRPRVILHMTNDAWFGQVSGPYQHLAQARLRAVEQGLPVLRAANTGISAVIDPVGRVLASLPLGDQGYLDHALPNTLAQPIYARFGDRPLLILLIVSGFGFAAHAARQKHIRND